MNRKHLSKNLEIENYRLEDNTILTIDPDAIVEIKVFNCGKDVTVHLNNSTLILETGTVDKNFKLSGNGNLKINSSLTLNGKSSIHAENIEIELTDAALNISSGKIYLDNCPVIGGEINSTGECAAKNHRFKKICI